MTRQYKLLKVGSDAEFFLLKDKNPFPVCGLLGGTKENPRPVLEGNGYAVQEDNVLVEFNIPPANTAIEFHESISKMLSYLKEEMQKNNLECRYNSSELFEQKILEQYPQAYQFGCEPDFCVWTKSVNPSPEFPGVWRNYPNKPKTKDDKIIYEPRTAGYHIHVSYLVDNQPSSLADKELFVKAQDLFLGVSSVLLETSNSRRKYYGRAGAFRPKEYGHEYRVLGSALLSNDHKINQWIFNQNCTIIKWLNTQDATKILDSNKKNIIKAINSHDRDIATQLIKYYNIVMP